MSEALDELRRLVPPPEDPPPPADWTAARDELGFDLPEDYRELIDLYGPGLFDEELRVLAPGHQNEGLDLLRGTDQQLRGLRYRRDQAGEHIPYEPEPVGGGLIAWGITGNGDVCYWRVVDAEAPASWTVVVDEVRGGEWHPFDGTVTEFLAGLFSGRVRAEFYGGSWPSGSPAFQRLG
jgi:hypothetical protein